MIKTLALLLLLALNNLCYSQSIEAKRQNLAKIISPEVCNCLNNLNEKDIRHKTKNYCMPEVLKSYTTELNEVFNLAFQSQGDSINKDQEAYFQELTQLNIFLELQNNLITTCNTYAAYIESQLNPRMEIIPFTSDEDALSSIATSESQLKDFKGDASVLYFHYYLGAAYKYLGKLNKALQHTNIAIDRSNMPKEKCYLLKAHIFFMKKDYKNAHEFYIKAFEKDKQLDTLIYIKLCEKKLKDSNISFKPMVAFAVH